MRQGAWEEEANPKNCIVAMMGREGGGRKRKKRADLLLQVRTEGRKKKHSGKEKELKGRTLV